MKRFFIAFVIILLIPTFAYSQEQDTDINNEEYNNYVESFDLSAFDELDNETKDFLEALEIDDFDYNSLTEISVSDILNHIVEIIRQRAESPVKSILIIVAYIILSSLFSSLSSEINGGLSSSFSTVSVLVISIFLSYRLTDCITLSYQTIKLCSDFSFAFFPAFCIITATAGSPVTSFSVNTTLLILAQGLNYIAELFFVPVTNCFLALGICSGLRSELNLSGAVSMLKRVITTGISTLSAIFVSILSVKTAVASKADAIGLRSVRFAINSVVPVIGSSISEGLLSIQSYSSLIKTSVGIVGIIAVVSIFLPALIEVNMWRLVLSLSGVTAEVFNDISASRTVNAFKDALLIIDVLLILTMVTTIISIGILVAAKSVS